MWQLDVATDSVFLWQKTVVANRAGGMSPALAEMLIAGQGAGAKSNPVRAMPEEQPAALLQDDSTKRIRHSPDKNLLTY